MAHFGKSKYSKIYNSESFYSTPGENFDTSNMQLKCSNINVNNLEELPQKVEDMYKILVGIAKELSNIKQIMAEEDNEVINNDAESLGVFDGDDYKTLMEMDEFKSQESITLTNLPNNLMYKNANLDGSSASTVIGDVQKGVSNFSFQPQFRDRLSYSSLSTTHDILHTAEKDSTNSQLWRDPQEEPHKETAVTHLHSNARAPSPFIIIANKLLTGPVILNIGGKKHEVQWDTLNKFPTSRLGRLRNCVTHRGLQELCNAYSLAKREYYFDRSPRNFDAILGLYRTDKLHLSQGVCVQDFCEELEYWGLNDLHLEPCCQHTYYRARWLLPSYGIQDDDLEEEFGSHYYSRVQKQLWNLFENPHDSCAAKVVAVVSCMFVVVSTLCLIFSTLPKFQQKDQNGIVQEEDFFEIAEAVFVGWFTFEYVIRFIAAPHKLRFIKGGMNIIDLLGILPYFASLCLSLVTTSTPVSEGGINGSGLGNSTVPSGHLGGASGGYQDEMRRIAQIFRIMRILRIFKLARHITGLQTLGMTLKNSYKELGLLMLVVIMGMLIFSGLAYVSEKDTPDTKFISMPQALYWAIITMTSVGYGDISPTTWFGKLVGSACAICGVLCISLPIPIIVNNFNKFYEKAKIEEEITAKKKKSAWDDCQKDSEGGGKAENGESGYKVVMNGRRPSQLVQPQHGRRPSQLPHPHPHPPTGPIISNHNKTKQQEGVHLNKF